MINELEFSWLLNWQFSGLCTFEDLIYVNHGAPIKFRYARAIRHEPSLVNERDIFINGWQSVLLRELDDTHSLIKE